MLFIYKYMWKINKLFYSQKKIIKKIRCLNDEPDKPLCKKCYEIYIKKEYCKICNKPWSQKKKN